MERRVLAGAVLTAGLVVGFAAVGLATGRDLTWGVLAAGLAGGFLAGVLSQTGGHVGAGARAGGYGGASGFVLFVLVGTIQSIATGALSVPVVLGLYTLLVAALVVPLHALEGAIAAAAAVRIRRAAGRPVAVE